MFVPKISRNLKQGLVFFSLLITVSALGQAIYLNFFLSPSVTQAQNCTDVTSDARFNNGLLTTPSTPNPANRFGGNNAGGPGPCVINQDATQLATFQIPTYAELKRDFFEKISIRYLNLYHIDKETNPGGPGTCTIAGVPATEANLNFATHDKIINLANITSPTPINCNLILGGNPSGTRSAVVFIDGDLLITADSLYPNTHTQDVPPDQSAGVIYIAKGNVYIDRSVQTIDGVIMAGGTIFTSCLGISCGPDRTSTTARLVVYGNLINLGLGQQIRFLRDLSLVNGNATPAEQVIADPKYLALFHQLFAQTFSVQTEDTNFAIR